MPQVPYNPIPQIASENIATPGPRVDTPLAAFGGDLGRAMSGLGQTLERSGDELFGRAYALQQLNNETEAREADAQYMMQAGELHANYNALQGRDRVTAFPKYSQDLQDLRIKLRSGLSNPAAQKMYDASSLSTMGRSIFNGAGAAAAANKEWSINTVKSQLELDAKAVEDNPGDEGLFQDKLRRIKDSASNLAAQTGVDGPGEELLVKKATSKAWTSRIIGMSRVAPFKALEVLEKNKTQLTEDDYLKVDNIVRAQGRAVGASNIATEVFAPDKKLSEMEDEARTRAGKINPDDPLLADHAVANVRTKFNQDKYATRQEELETNQRTMDIIVQGRPHNEQEFLQLPGAQALYDKMKPSERLALPGKINRYVSAVNRYDNENEMLRLNGMRNSDDPAAREEFLNTDPTKLNLSQGQMIQIQNQQSKMKEKAEADPRVNRALTMLRSSMGAQLEALGVYKRTEANKADYDHYVGAVQSSIDAWNAEYGKPPTPKDITETIGPQVIRERTEPAWFGLSTTKTPFFKQEVPERFATIARQEAKNPNLSDEAIYKLYVRMQLKELYSKSPKKSTERAPQ